MSELDLFPHQFEIAYTMVRVYDKTQQPDFSFFKVLEKSYVVMKGSTREIPASEGDIMALANADIIEAHLNSMGGNGRLKARGVQAVHAAADAQQSSPPPSRMLTEPDILQDRKDRFAFLHRLWQLSGGSESAYLPWQQLGNELGFDETKTVRIVQFLRGEGLIRFGSVGMHVILISHQGVREVEEALATPEKPTHFFPALNVINVHTMTNSSIQQGSPQSVQELKLAVNDVAAITKSIDAAVSAIRTSGNDAAAAEALADATTIKTQLASPKPKRSILTAALSSLKSIVEQTVASAASTGVLASLNAAMHLIN